MRAQCLAEEPPGMEKPMETPWLKLLAPHIQYTAPDDRGTLHYLRPAMGELWPCYEVNVWLH